ncbi:MAG: APC family permease [Tissierellia bacterium]|nr:APC family permease [Tissierellia bacterium]
MKTIESSRQAYGLSTTITMIVGIVIGSGIFFKSDDILRATGGNFKLGILVLIMGAMGIIFGSLTLSELALRDSGSGGAVSYFNYTWGHSMGSGFGLFQTFVYYPSITVVISWVAGIYTFMLLNINPSLEQQMVLGIAYMVGFILLNTLSRIVGGYFQNASTFIKLVPLFFIAIAGLVYKGSQPVIPEGVDIIEPTNVGFGWLTGLAPIAFSYDGWIIATSIAPEVKNPEKNMPRALVLAPIFILLCYVLYFTGIVKMMGETFVLSMGDNTVDYISTMLLGEKGGALMMMIVIISVLGVVNGVIMGGIRMPQAMAEKGMILPKSVGELHPKLQISIKSAFVYLLICIFWYGLHYITQKYGLLGGRDVSEISIVFSYTSYILLYWKILDLYKTGEIQNSFRGFISPILATVAAVLMVIGSLLSSPGYIGGFLITCMIIFYIGYSADRKKNL